MDLESVKQFVQAGGGGLAVFVSLYLVKVFLEQIRAITAEFLAEIAASSARNEKAMADMAAEHAATRATFQAQVQALSDRMFEVVEKTATAVGDLRIAINELKARIDPPEKLRRLRRRGGEGPLPHLPSTRRRPDPGGHPPGPGLLHAPSSTLAFIDSIVHPEMRQPPSDTTTESPG